jgi:hypothetical protein
MSRAKNAKAGNTAALEFKNNFSFAPVAFFARHFFG